MSVPKKQREILDFVTDCEITDIITTPTLYSKSVSVTGLVKYYHWTAHIEISNSDIYPISLDMITERLESWPDDYTVKYYTISGQMPDKSNPKPAATKSKKTVVLAGTNIGRINFTTPLTQAIYRVRSEYLKRIKKGAELSVGQFESKSTMTISELINKSPDSEHPWRVYPMALHNVNEKNNWKRVKYPAYIQPKLNGARMTIVNAEGHIDAYSRGGESINVVHILDDMSDMLAEYPNVYFDGEYYSHDSELQSISGSFRQLVIKDELDFYVFDTFIVSGIETYEERLARTTEIFNRFPLNRVFNVKPILVNNKRELMRIYRVFLNERFEGAVIRNSDSPYEFGFNKERRSYSTLKLKPRFDMEFRVIGYTTGTKGKAVGKIIWICTIDAETVKRMAEMFADKYPAMKTDVSEIDVPLTFNVTPNVTEEISRGLYLLAESGFDEFYNKWATISFSEPSVYAKPQQPKFLQFRDTEFNDKIMNLAEKFS